MTKRIHKAISLYPEDLEKLKILAEAALMKESTYIRVLIGNEYARMKGKQVTSHNVQYGEKENPIQDEDGKAEVVEPFSLTENLPKKYIYWEVINYKREETYLFRSKSKEWLKAADEVPDGWYLGMNAKLRYLTPDEAAKRAVELHQEAEEARAELKRMGIL